MRRIALGLIAMCFCGLVGWAQNVKAPAALLHCRFQCDGKPVPRVNRLVVLALDAEPPALPERPFRTPNELPPLTPVPAGDGYEVKVPGPGKYRLLVDCFDDSVPPLPGMVVTVPAEGADTVVALPPPVLTVPRGAEVGWLTRHAPQRPQSLIATAGETVVPVFGSADGLLAAWFRPAPDVLMVRHPAGALVRHTLQRAAVTVAPEPNVSAFVYLSSLLPVPYQRAWDTLPREGNSHLLGRNVPYGRTELPAIWSGRYLVQGGGKTTALTVVEGQANELTFTVPANAPLRTNAGVRIGFSFTEPVKLPVMDDGNWGGSRDISTPTAYVFANGGSMPVTQLIAHTGGEEFQWLPPDTKTITIYCPGVGMIRDLTVDLQAEKPHVDLKGWQPGVELDGQLLLAPGHPASNQPFTVTTEFGSQFPMMTDALGEFRVPNLLPGTVFFTCRRGETNYSFAVPVPAKGQANLRLTLRGGVTINTGGHGSQVWWLPDGGMPVRVMAGAAPPPQVCGLVPGPGRFWLWSDDRQRETYFHRAIVTPGGTVTLNDTLNEPLGSYLGLSVPLPPDAALPGDVEVEGLGPLAALRLRVSYTQVWRISTELNAVLGQIGPLPPGHYRIRCTVAGVPVQRKVTVTESGGGVELP